MKKSLSTIMRECFQEYLTGINKPFKKSMKISELIEITMKNNSSAPDRAVGMVTQVSIKKYEAQ